MGDWPTFLLQSFKMSFVIGHRGEWQEAFARGFLRYMYFREKHVQS